jgi:hypothetical protein
MVTGEAAMRWWARGLSGVVSAALLLSLPGPAGGGPFRVSTELPPLGEWQQYEVVADGYALRRSYSLEPDDTLAVFDLNDGRELWSADPGVGNVTTHVASDGVLVVLGSAREDGVTNMSHSQTVGLDLRTGRELWRRPHSLVGPPAGSVVAITCNGCREDSVGVDLRTGAQLWRAPWQGTVNLVERDMALLRDDQGTLRSLDLRTGRLTTLGTLPPGSWIVDATERHLLVKPEAEYPEGGGTALPTTVTVYDRATFAQGQTFPMPKPGMVPWELSLCGEDTVCARPDFHDTQLYDLDSGKLLSDLPNFALGGSVDVPSRGTVVAGFLNPGRRGVDRPHSQLLDRRTGAVLADLVGWSPVLNDGDRLWVVELALGQPGRLGRVDLDAAVLRVTPVARFGTGHDDCQLRHGWLLCAGRDLATAMRLRVPAETGAGPDGHWS